MQLSLLFPNTFRLCQIKWQAWGHGIGRFPRKMFITTKSKVGVFLLNKIPLHTVSAEAPCEIISSFISLFLFQNLLCWLSSSKIFVSSNNTIKNLKISLICLCMSTPEEDWNSSFNSRSQSFQNGQHIGNIKNQETGRKSHYQK